jgi:pyridoxal phosphate enzyme (YggS family)
MIIAYDEFRGLADALRAAMTQACVRAGRTPDAVALLPVTKSQPAAAVEYAARYGLSTVGENRVQEAVEKRAQTTATVRWELIGHLQSNKVSLAVRHFDRIQSVDSEKLINLIDRAASDLGRTMPILLQINAGRDPAKFGAEPEAAPRLVEAALAKSHIRLDGLMTIAPLSPDFAVAERTFANLRNLRDELAGRCKVPLPELSMGMSGDYPAAIAAGSTLIRIGTALFRERQAPAR